MKEGKNMHYAQIREIDVANGEGIRVSLYKQGCHIHCPGCFNEETWDFNKGKPFTQKEVDVLVNLINKHHIKGFTLLGGEPMSPENKDVIDDLLRQIHERCPGKDIWVYSSYTWEVLLERRPEALAYMDILVDGPFIEDLKYASLKFRGSSNQRIIDVQESLKTHSVVRHPIYDPDLGENEYGKN